MKLFNEINNIITKSSKKTVMIQMNKFNNISQILTMALLKFKENSIKDSLY